MLNPILGGLVPQPVPFRLWEPVAVIEHVVPTNPVYCLVRFRVTWADGFRWELPEGWESDVEPPPARPPLLGVWW